MCSLSFVSPCQSQRTLQVAPVLYIVYSLLACTAGILFGRANAIAAILDFKSRGRLGCLLFVFLSLVKEKESPKFKFITPGIRVFFELKAFVLEMFYHISWSRGYTVVNLKISYY